MKKIFVLIGIIFILAEITVSGANDTLRLSQNNMKLNTTELVQPEAENKSQKDKSIIWQFLISGLGGVNYFIWDLSPGYQGWGDSYGLEGEGQFIFLKENIGLGVSYSKIYEDARYNGKVGMFRRVVRDGMLFKVFINPAGKVKPWFGIGKDNFNIIYVEDTYSYRDITYITWIPSYGKGTEIFQIVAVGVDINLPIKNTISGFECKYGTNETNNTTGTNLNYNSFQILFKIGYKWIIL